MSTKKESVKNLAAQVKHVAKKGRGNDTILAHINPREAMILKLMGGSGVINPKTGILEFDDGGDFYGGSDFSLDSSSPSPSYDYNTNYFGTPSPSYDFSSPTFDFSPPPTYGGYGSLGMAPDYTNSNSIYGDIYHPALGMTTDFAYTNPTFNYSDPTTYNIPGYNSATPAATGMPEYLSNPSSVGYETASPDSYANPNAMPWDVSSLYEQNAPGTGVLAPEYLGEPGQPNAMLSSADLVSSGEDSAAKAESADNYEKEQDVKRAKQAAAAQAEKDKADGKGEKSLVDKALEALKGKLPSMALTAGQAMGASSAGKTAQNQYNAIAGPSAEASKQLLENFKKGQLSAADQQGIASWQQKQKAAVDSYYQKAGLGNSSMHRAALSKIDQEADKMRQQSLDNMLKQGLGAAGVANPILQAGIAARTNADAQTNAAIANYLRMLGGMAEPTKKEGE